MTVRKDALAGARNLETSKRTPNRDHKGWRVDLVEPLFGVALHALTGSKTAWVATAGGITPEPV